MSLWHDLRVWFAVTLLGWCGAVMPESQVTAEARSYLRRAGDSLLAHYPSEND